MPRWHHQSQTLSRASQIWRTGHPLLGQVV